MKLQKSLEELDRLADDLLKSEEKDEENKAKGVDEEDPSKEPESLNDQAKHQLETPPEPDTEAGGELEQSAEKAEAESKKSAEGDDVEKAAKPEEIADEEEEDENNQAGDNNKKLADKNKSKAKGKDETDDDPGDKREKEENDDDEDEDEKQVEKSSRDIFRGLMKSVKTGSPEEDFIDAVSKSMMNAETSAVNTYDMMEQVSETIVKSMNTVVKSNQNLQAQNAELMDVVKSQKEAIDALIGKQESFEKSVNTQVNDFGSQPRARKSTVSVMEKSFDHSAGLQEGTGNLSKSEVLDKLTQMAIDNSNGVTVQDVMQFESQGNLRPEVERALKS